MPLIVLGAVVGVVLFLILVVTVAAWWVAAISGLGVILLVSLVGAFAEWSKENRQTGAYSS
jgi:hypothetical protein